MISKVSEKIVTPKTADSDQLFFAGMFQEEDELENTESVRAALNLKKTEEINLEIRKFSDLIATDGFAKTNSSSNQFWKNNKQDYSHLCTLFIMFNAISASSAYIERFFSICGIISTQRNQNSNEDLFNARAMILCSVFNDSL